MKKRPSLQCKVHFHDDVTQIGPAVVFDHDALYPLLQKMRVWFDRVGADGRHAEPIALCTTKLLAVTKGLVFNAPSPGVYRFGSAWMAAFNRENWPIKGAGVFLISVKTWECVYLGGPGFDTSLTVEQYNEGIEQRQQIEYPVEGEKPEAKPKRRAPAAAVEDPYPGSALAEIIESDAMNSDKLIPQDGDADFVPVPGGPKLAAAPAGAKEALPGAFAQIGDRDAIEADWGAFGGQEQEAPVESRAPETERVSNRHLPGNVDVAERAARVKPGGGSL